MPWFSVFWSVAQGLAYPFHRYFCAPPFQHSCFLFLPATMLTVPNTVRFLGYLLALLLLLEVRPALFPQRFMAAVSLFLAVVPWFLLEIQGATVRLFPLLVVYSLLLWIFLCKFHQSRLKALGRGRGQAGRLRLIPTLFILLLGSLFIRELTVYRQSPRAVRIPALAYDPQAALFDGKWIWYSETVGARAGLWRYDPDTQEATPALRAQDSRAFCLEGDAVYLYDGFEGVVQRVGKESRRVEWAVPVPRGQGPFELVLQDERLFVLGAKGYLAVLDQRGRKETERSLALPIRHLTPLGAGQVAFVSLDPWLVVIADARLQVQEVLLPPTRGAGEWNRGWPGIPFLAGTAYDPRLRTLWIGTLWGEIFRYDVGRRRWEPAWRTSAGLYSIAVDEKNRLFFAYNRARGVVETLDLDSGRHLQYILVSVFGNALQPWPAQRSAVLSVRGPDSISVPKPGGLYRLDAPKRPQP